MAKMGAQHVALHRAKVAFDFAKQGKESDKYVSYVRRLPSLIQTNGLGAALAFVFAKAKFGAEKRGADAEAYGLLYTHVRQWLEEHSILRETLRKAYDQLKENREDVNGPDRLTEAIVSLDPRSYRLATQEVLAFLQWLRRFAEGLNPRGAEMVDGEDGERMISEA